MTAGVNYCVVGKMKKPLRDYQMIRFLGRRISAIDVDHQQLKLSDDDGDDDSGGAVDDLDIFDDWSAENEEPEQYSRIFWESQECLIQEILDQCNSSGTKLREQIKRHINMVRDSNFCNCIDKKLRGCTKCLRQVVVNHLCSKGFNAALCTSKWKRTHKIPGGSHEYIEVIASTQGRRKQIPLVVELGFQDEFKIAKSCNEYDRLIDRLPEIYIGKTEHLNAIIRVVCEAAKKSAKERKIHMGPWRKRGFMEMKWSGSSKTRFPLGKHKSSDEVRNSSSIKLI